MSLPYPQDRASQHEALNFGRPGTREWVTDFGRLWVRVPYGARQIQVGHGAEGDGAGARRPMVLRDGTGGGALWQLTARRRMSDLDRTVLVARVLLGRCVGSGRDRGPLR